VGISKLLSLRIFILFTKITAFIALLRASIFNSFPSFPRGKFVQVSRK
jgi:hypothetical protein